MIHANVVEGHDLASIWGDDHHGASARAPVSSPEST